MNDEYLIECIENKVESGNFDFKRIYMISLS